MRMHARVERRPLPNMTLPLSIPFSPRGTTPQGVEVGLTTGEEDLEAEVVLEEASFPKEVVLKLRKRTLIRSPKRKMTLSQIRETRESSHSGAD